MHPVVGIDTSLTDTGIALIRDPQPQAPVELRRVRSKGKATDTLSQRRERLDRIAGQIVRETLSIGPELVVIEAPSFGSKHGHAHDRSGLWWLVVFSLTAHVPVLEVAPTKRMKYATGKGQVAKDVVLTSVVRRYPWVQVADNNEADALVLAAIGARLLGAPVEPDLPKGHLGAMDGLSL